MKMRDVMTTEPVLLEPGQTIRDATRIFLERSIDGAPVVDEQRHILGLFTKSHIYRALYNDTDLSTPIEDVMTLNIWAGHPEDEVESQLEPTVGRVPVVDDDQVVGMITRTDLAKVFFNQLQMVSVELDAILNSTHNMIVSVNKDAEVHVFNAAAERYLGCTVEEVRGKHINNFFPTSRLPEVMQSGQAELLEKIELKGKYYISNRTPIFKDGKIVGAVAVLQDIDEFEKLSQELQSVKELNRELDAIIESSFDGLYITDGDGMTLRLNKAFEMISGVDGSEFMGKYVDKIESEGIVSESVSSLVLKKREPVTIVQQTKAGRTSLATGTPIFDKKGKIFRVVCNVRDITELNSLKQQLEQVQGLSQHYEHQLRTMRMQYTNTDMVLNSPKMKELLDTATRLARVDSTVLIVGESGTGKELFAEVIHNNSQRSNGPFLKVNCGAIPDNLLESELFGYEAGAFTGAKKGGKPGYFEVSDGGTIFLDEISELPYNLQVKLLRFLQGKEITRIGGTDPFQVDVRVLAATNRNILQMVNEHKFRADLYYRLNVVPLNIPPLRERKEDIPGLVYHFLQLFNKKYHMSKRVNPEVLKVFMKYDWPGNVRELENLMERLVVVTSGDIIEPDDLPSFSGVNGRDRLDSSAVIVTGLIPMQEAVEAVERQLLEKAYSQFQTTRQMAAELKVNASTVVRKAAKYGISS